MKRRGRTFNSEGMVTTSTSTADAPLPVAERLRALRAHMKAADVDAVVIPSADRWLNEYVPRDRSDRVALTGFTGSMGDAVITGDRALLIVDGRYTLQASQECPDFEVHTIPLSTSILAGWLDRLAELAEQGVKTLAAPASTLPRQSWELLLGAAEAAGISVVPGAEVLFERARHESGIPTPKLKGKAWPITPALVGRTVKQRLDAVAPALRHRRVDAFLSVPLDEVCWLTNLRGDVFPYQATAPARALVFADEVVLCAFESRLKKDAALEAGVRLARTLTEGLADAAAAHNGAGVRVGIDPGSTPEALVLELEAAGVTVVPLPSPLRPLRTQKTEEELAHMVAAFRRADLVVKRLQTWLGNEVSKGQPVTEKDVADKLWKLFKRSGAVGHSFATIAGAGEHGAIIHYNHPDAETPIPEGALFLLDCGAFYEGGLATDLTRTFTVGRAHVKPTDRQRTLFTLVLKGAIAGMSARIPVGTSGEQLDALVRQPLWQAGLDYKHGTGHGVGVNVHEFPPRIAPKVSAPVEAGQVFSIEPGLYLPGELGIRIENLCTAVPDPDDEGFLRIKPLTFSPLDRRLIDRSLLTPHERSFLAWFAERFKQDDALAAPLPPLPALPLG